MVWFSVDRDVATSGVLTVEELCEAYGSTRSVKEKIKKTKMNKIWCQASPRLMKL
jgi:ribosomal protein S19E (S16A)